MASEIKVDTIVNAGGDNDTGIDLATNDQILLKVANATRLTMNSTGQTTIVGEGGTTTTSLQQGLAKHWLHSVVSGSTPANTDSLNTSSITDVTAGDYKPQLTSAMANATFSVSMLSGYTTTGGTGAFFHQYVPTSSSTTQYHVQHYQNASKADASGFSSSVLGDLA